MMAKQDKVGRVRISVGMRTKDLLAAGPVSV